MLERAQGKPIRVASKSIRCRALLEAILEPRRALRRADDLHPARDPVAGRAGVRGPAARLPDRRRRARSRSWRCARPRIPAGAPIVMVDCVEHLDAIESVLGAGGGAGPGLHRHRRQLVGAGRADQGRAEALAGPHGRAGGGAGARDRAPAADRTRRADGLRGADRRRRRPAAGTAPARRRDPLHAAALRRRAGRAAGGDRRRARRVRRAGDRQRRRHRQPRADRGRGRR